METGTRRITYESYLARKGQRCDLNLGLLPQPLCRENILVLDIFFEVLNYETIEQKKAYEIAGLLGELLMAPVPFPCHGPGVTPSHPKQAAHLCPMSSSSSAIPGAFPQMLLSWYVVEGGG